MKKFYNNLLVFAILCISIIVLHCTALYATDYDYEYKGLKPVEHDTIGYIVDKINKEDPYCQQKYEKEVSFCYNSNLCYLFTDADTFKSFINIPDSDFLEEAFSMPDKVMVFECMQTDTNDYGTKYIKINDPDYYVVYDEFWPNNYYNSKAFFIPGNFNAISMDSLQEKLNKNGINEEITHKTIILNPDYPAMVFIETISNSYFLVYDGLENYGNQEIMLYSIYTVEEFQQKAFEKYVDLYANGKKIQGDNNVLVRWDRPYIRLKAFIEAIGGTDIQWNGKEKSVVFYMNMDKMEIFPNNDMQLERYYKNDEPYINTNWIYKTPIFINDYLYFNTDYLFSLLTEYNKTYCFDGDKFSLQDKQ